ncbi:hypothetical protein [Glaesserella parasuis]|uniref:hypothetical protein n=1 Tax=Glaesserella parasuis TaxID=738 RepID=UPI0021BD46ED|nr:hypothetical protein [Glaesserella parasuis]MCT8588975.1 hypothetical protein [Glaesserella parasuis]MCT8599070.1 hypothetical protein [Glaesserella parasuis]MCT8601118.1 hypothetical protein [Glaesserella parasuis]MCT8605181.1 hypothetical protein [Glaesserella parasuis]
MIILLDVGRWTLDVGRWTLDVGRWTLDVGRWTFIRVSLLKDDVEVVLVLFELERRDEDEPLPNADSTTQITIIQKITSIKYYSYELILIETTKF